MVTRQVLKKCLNLLLFLPTKVLHLKGQSPGEFFLKIKYLSKIEWKTNMTTLIKVEKILKGSLDSIPSPPVKIQIMGGKVCLRRKGKTLLGIINKLLKTKSLLTTPNNVLPYYLNLTFPPNSDGIKSRLSSLIFSTLQNSYSLISFFQAKESKC